MFESCQPSPETLEHRSTYHTIYLFLNLVLRNESVLQSHRQDLLFLTNDNTENYTYNFDEGSVYQKKV